VLVLPPLLPPRPLAPLMFLPVLALPPPLLHLHHWHHQPHHPWNLPLQSVCSCCGGRALRRAMPARAWAQGRSHLRRSA
jgi:hypothetical protein